MPLTNITNSPLPKLPPRSPESHKGTYGHALVVGGSRGMSGSISLSGLSTLRSGAGLVTLAVPRAIQDVVAGFNPSYMTRGLASANEHMIEAAADEVLALAEGMTVVALGPGLGRTPGTAAFVARLYREVKQPMVVDADALVALAEQIDLLTQTTAARILTPHPGEFARLTRTKPTTDDAARSQAAGELASASGTAKPDRRPQRPPHRHHRRHALRPEPNRQPRHGHRRHRRRTDRHHHRPPRPRPRPLRRRPPRRATSTASPATSPPKNSAKSPSSPATSSTTCPRRFRRRCVERRTV